MKPKQYYIFAGSHEPSGGWEDFVASCDGAETVTSIVQGVMLDEGVDWIQVVDVEERNVVFRAVRFVRGSWMIAPHSTEEDLEV